MRTVKYSPVNRSYASTKPANKRRSQLQVEELEHRVVPSTTPQLEALPNDPYAGSSYLWGMTKIAAPTAWNTTTGSSQVVVADIDTGIDYTHPDLYLNLWINQGEIPAGLGLTDVDGGGISFRDLNASANAGKVADVNSNSYIDGKDVLVAWSNGADGSDYGTYVDDILGWNFFNNTNDVLDGHGHGTHTAGTIGAIGNNGVGVVGVNWQVQIMVVQVFGFDGTAASSQGFGDAIRYAADMGARVSNNSWGYYGGSSSNPEYQAIAYAGTKNHLVVASAGNDGLNNDTSYWKTYPASFSLANIISVAATTSNDGRASFSNYGKVSVDLGAPGASILSTYPTYLTAPGYLPYAYMSGTSMAAPHVTGAAALLLAKNPNLSVAQLKANLLNNVDKVSSLNNKTVTGGRLNVSKALNATVAGAAPSGSTTPAPLSGGGNGHKAAGLGSWLVAAGSDIGAPVRSEQAIAAAAPSQIGQILVGVQTRANTWSGSETESRATPAAIVTSDDFQGSVVAFRTASQRGGAGEDTPSSQQLVGTSDWNQREEDGQSAPELTPAPADLEVGPRNGAPAMSSYLVEEQPLEQFDASIPAESAPELMSNETAGLLGAAALLLNGTYLTGAERRRRQELGQA